MTRSPRLPRLVGASLAALALAFGLAACGGDDDTPAPTDSTSAVAETETETAPTAEEFVAEANAVCEELYPAINEVASTITPDDPTTVEPFVPLVQELQDELNAVTPSDDLAEDFAAVMAQQQANLDAVTADPAALFTIDGGTINDEFDALGITSCGTASSDIS